MKKIIDGKLYDTDKAEWVCEHSDDAWCSIQLYLTPKKAWFQTHISFGSEHFYKTINESEVKKLEVFAEYLELYTKYFGEPEEA